VLPYFVAVPAVQLLATRRTNLNNDKHDISRKFHKKNSITVCSIIFGKGNLKKKVKNPAELHRYNVHLRVTTTMQSLSQKKHFKPQDPFHVVKPDGPAAGSGQAYRRSNFMTKRLNCLLR
jgi:hypothetical protein